jgi:hypothetical protein
MLHLQVCGNQPKNRTIVNLVSGENNTGDCVWSLLGGGAGAGGGGWARKKVQIGDMFCLLHKQATDSSSGFSFLLAFPYNGVLLASLETDHFHID